MIKNKSKIFHRAQKGSSLLMVMLLLMLSGSMGLLAMKMSKLDEIAGRNTRDTVTAMQSAEAALKDARNDLLSEKEFKGKIRFFNGATGSRDNCPSAEDNFKGFYSKEDGTPGDFWKEHLKNSACSLTFGEVTERDDDSMFDQVVAGAVKPNALRAQPRYILESIIDDEDFSLTNNRVKYLYRISAIGFGRLAGTEVILQEVVRIPEY